ncbi:F-box cyclin-like [Colletotrichum tofieldiae]|nr:F-box cyclin-like [Colletotrichum tofieldiae]
MLEADLRQFTLETDEDGSLEREPHPLNLTRDHFIPLRSIFPVDAWKNLAHFGLSRFLINQQGLFDFLTVLPQTLTR